MQAKRLTPQGSKPETERDQGVACGPGGSALQPTARRECSQHAKISSINNAFFRSLLLALAFVAVLSAADSFTVSGVVVDSRSHAALPNARVMLAPTMARTEKLEMVTKQDGQFSFVVNRAGKYSLQMTKPGYPVQAFRQGALNALSTAIVVRDDQDTSHIVFEARRGGTITGQIKDDDGEPVGNALVAVFQLAIVGGERKIVSRGQTRANAVGEFRMANLPPGDYYVCAMGRPWFTDSLLQFQVMQEGMNRAMRRAATQGQPPSDDAEQFAPKFSPEPNLRGTAYLTTFYPRATSAEEASLVHVDAGGETQVAISLPLAKAVTVKVTMSLPGEMTDGRANLLKKVGDQAMQFLNVWVPKAGVFEFQNVPSGSYEIVASSQAPSGGGSWHVRQAVEVGASDMEVTLRPPPMGTVSGHVQFDGEAPGPGVSLFVSLRNEKGTLFRAQVNPEGQFSLARLPLDKYEMTAGSADFIASYSTDASGARLPLTVEITSGEPVRRDVTLTRAVATIDGTVEKGGVPQIGAFVLLLPKDAKKRWASRVDQTDSDGSYRLKTIAAGDYLLIVLSDGAEVAYRDPKVAAILAKVSKPVHVEPNDKLDLKIDVVENAGLHLPVS